MLDRMQGLWKSQYEQSRRLCGPVCARLLYLGLALLVGASSDSLPGDGLLVAFEATAGVEYDSNQQVIGWSSQHDTHWSSARTNSSRTANRDQRRNNAAIDETLLSDAHGLPSLARAHEVDSRDLADSRPMFVDRGNGLAALEFDGDDYLELPVAYQPRDGGLTMLALLRLQDDPTELVLGGQSTTSVVSPPRRRPHSTRYWFGMGSPASSSDVQYSVSAIGSQIRIHVVPVAHDNKRPSVRHSARLRAASAFDKDTLVSISLDGMHVHARMDGNATAFVGSNRYGGKISFEEDYGFGKAKSFIGSGPSAPEHWLYTGEGARGMLMSLVVYSRALDEPELRVAELYIACKHRHVGYFQGDNRRYLDECEPMRNIDPREL